MSYDVTLELLDAKGRSHEMFWRNHTSNTAVMWREAGCDLAAYHGMTAGELAQALHPAVADIKARPAYYAVWNPENRWGSVQTTVEFLEAVLDACQSWPDARVDVCR